jgi:hypothetical protein
VRLWSGGVTPLQFQAAKPKLRPLLEKVAAGKDLKSHLSGLVDKKGVILPGARPADQGKDIDMVLTRQGLHHFHVGVSAPCNPKGRSGSLVFAEVLEKEFRIVAISDHRAFKRGSTEQLKFFRICHSYMAKDVPPGQPRGEAAETITNRNADAVAGALVLEGLDEGATLCARLDQ